MTATETATAVVSTIDPSWVAIASLLLTFLIFPFAKYYFTKNEKLHEVTQASVARHEITLGLHEYRIISLEEWRRINTAGATPPATTGVTVNH